MSSEPVCCSPGQPPFKSEDSSHLPQVFQADSESLDAFEASANDCGAGQAPGIFVGESADIRDQVDDLAQQDLLVGVSFALEKQKGRVDFILGEFD